MRDTKNLNFSIDEIMDKIKKEVEGQRVPAEILQNPSNVSKKIEVNVVSKKSAESYTKKLEHKKKYHINDFLKFNDYDFVATAYQCILQRQLDYGGEEIYLKKLREGRISKIEVLGRICYSPEGRRNKIKIKNLFLRFCIHTSFHIPLFGYIFRILTGIFHLPIILRNFQILENFTQMQQIHIEELREKLYLLGVETINKLEFNVLKNEKVDKLEFAIMKEEKAERTELEALKEEKAERTELEALKEEKAERTELEALKEEKAERTELEALKEEKAERTELEALKEEKAERAELEALKEEKAERTELEALKEEKAERKELEALKEEKADRTELKQNIIEVSENVSFVQSGTKDELSRITEKLTSTEADLKKDIAQVFEKVAATKSGMKDELSLITEHFVAGESNFMDNIRQLSESISSTENSLKNDIDQVAGSITTVESVIKDDIQNITKKVLNYSRSLIDQERRLVQFLNEARKRLPEPFSREQLDNLVSEESHMHDAMYAAFEDHFRGTREDIKERQKVYLPYIEKVMQQIDGGVILDVGCGRGEWLELLKEEGHEARGVDINRVMVSECADRALDVVESDVIEYLRAQKANSFSVITGFHIVEHLPYSALIKLFDESLRVLRSGGIVIYETPNPENLIVGAHYFYTDVSHINPLVPSSLQFLVEQRGFGKVEIKRLHKYSDHHEVLTDDKFITAHFYNEMDFSVICYKI
jgi:2-polyprenyl-3-methyl-5-hydroxy-6-metoxy-1,4-benzoquinol methylase